MTYLATDAVGNLPWDDRAQKEFGRIDTLVNCAGVAPQDLMEELTPELFETILRST